MKKKVVITGSNGFIGKYLTELFEKHSYDVIKLQRSIKKKNDNKTFEWKLGDKFPEQALSSHIFIHCAYDSRSERLKNNFKQNLNYVGLKKILSQLRSKTNYELYFLSSQSAQDKTRSYYGRLKYQMEKLIKYDNNNGVEIIIRPGMVYGKNSSVTQLIKKITKLKIVPFFSLEKNIQPIDINDLCECIHKIISNRNKLSHYNLAIEEGINFKKYVEFICEDNLISKPFFIYIPPWFVIFLANLFDLTRISRLSLSERVFGLLFLNKLNTKKSLHNINYKLNNPFLH